MCDSIGAVGLRASFQLWLSSQKTAAVGVGYQPALAAAVIAAGVGHHLPSLGVRGLFECRCCNMVLCSRGRSWAVAGGLPNHGRQRPLPISIQGDGNRRLHSMACFAARGEGGIGRSRSSLLMCFGPSHPEQGPLDMFIQKKREKEVFWTQDRTLSGFATESCCYLGRLYKK